MTEATLTEPGADLSSDGVGEDREALEDGRRPEPLVEAHEVLASGHLPGPQQGGGELQGVRGPERVRAKEAERLGAERVTGLDDVGRVERGCEFRGT